MRTLVVVVALLAMPMAQAGMFPESSFELKAHQATPLGLTLTPSDGAQATTIILGVPSDIFLGVHESIDTQQGEIEPGQIASFCDLNEPLGDSLIYIEIPSGLTQLPLVAYTHPDADSGFLRSLQLDFFYDPSTDEEIPDHCQQIVSQEDQVRLTVTPGQLEGTRMMQRLDALLDDALVEDAQFAERHIEPILGELMDITTWFRDLRESIQEFNPGGAFAWSQIIEIEPRVALFYETVDLTYDATQFALQQISVSGPLTEFKQSLQDSREYPFLEQYATTQEVARPFHDALVAADQSMDTLTVQLADMIAEMAPYWDWIVNIVETMDSWYCCQEKAKDYLYQLSDYLNATSVSVSEIPVDLLGQISPLQQFMVEVAPLATAPDITYDPQPLYEFNQKQADEPLLGISGFPAIFVLLALVLMARRK